MRTEWIHPSYKLLFWWVCGLVIALAIGVGVLWYQFLAPGGGVTQFLKTGGATYVVAGDSMSPTLVDKQRIRLERPQGSTGPVVGDVVVLEAPAGWVRGVDTHPVIVKRVTGAGGDRITVKNGALYVNTTKIVDLSTLKNCGIPEGYSTTVPAGMFFVTGDNHAHSTDSLTQLCRDSTNTSTVWATSGDIKDYGAAQHV